MAVEIQLTKGEILPFTKITVFSPREAADSNVIAIAWDAFHDGRRYQYIDAVPTHDLVKIEDGHRRIGPIINHNNPLGNEEAVIHKIDFPGEGIVYVSKDGSLPLGSGMFGIWEEVG